MNDVEVLDEQIDLGESEESDRDGELLSDEDIIQVVSFSLSNEVEYGIDILSIYEILRIPGITRLPNTPPFIMGVLNLRGNVIPVVSVRARFGFSESRITDSTRIIVVGKNEKLFGLLVDHVYQVIRIPLKNINSPSKLI